MQLDHLNNIINKINDYCCVLDHKGLLLIANNNLLNLFDIENTSVLGEKFIDIFPLPRHAEFNEALTLTFSDGNERKINDFSPVFNSLVNISFTKFYDYVVVTLLSQHNSNGFSRKSKKDNSILGNLEIMDNQETLFELMSADMVMFDTQMNIIGASKPSLERYDVITESEKKKKTFSRLYRELRLVTEVCEIVFAAKDEFEMVENVCKQIIQIGGYQLVWFGYAPDNFSENQIISPLHKFGTAIHYLDNFVLDLSNPEHRKGPTAQALMTGKTIAINDFLNCDVFKPWKSAAQSHNLNSSITFPLNLGNGRTATLVIYAQEKNAFFEEEIKILNRLADAVAFSINSVHKRYENKISELKQDKLIKELNTRNRSLEEFTFMVSHNLRAKVADLLGISSLLNVQELPEKEKREFIDEMHKTSLKLDEVIKDLNSTLLVKDHLKLNYEWINLSELLAELEYKLNLRFPERKLIIKTDFSAINEVLSDRYYLFEAIFQLLQSLFKYNVESGHQQITIASHKTENSLHIVFTDDIKGIKIKDIENSIFEIYRKLYQHLTGGGIKLYYVKAIIENIDGKLTVNCDQNTKIAFTIELPHN